MSQCTFNACLAQVCCQLPSSADNMTLLAFAAERRAAVRLAAAAVDRCHLGPQQQPAAHCCSG